jgi:basic membrane protein A
MALRLMLLGLLLGGAALLASCGNAPAPTATPLTAQKVGVLIGGDTENDKGFNEYTLKGARQGAEQAGVEFTHLWAPSSRDYERYLEQLVAEGKGLVVTVGFSLADAMAVAAKKHPDVHFAIVDYSYEPGAGCPDTMTDCYTVEGGLPNVTSLMFAEDEVGYLAGVLAACVSQTGTIASVAGREIPPVKRFVVGYQQGARSVKPEIVSLNQYIPDFTDPETGKLVAEGFISQGADVIFGVGGLTGVGGLQAAKEAGVMAIGVDVDQYLSVPEVREVLLTSAMKNVDVAAGAAVRDFAAGTLESGVRLATVASGGVGLAPYHDWEEKIPAECKERVRAAEAAIKADPTITGGKP